MARVNVPIACLLGFLLACGRQTNRTESKASASVAQASSARASNEQVRALPEPTRLVTMPVSAYSASLALDDDAVVLLTSNAAYRLVPGEPAHGMQLDLGVGAVLTQSAFIFWSKGAIWRAPKEGGVARPVAKFPHPLQYFVSWDDSFAWVDRSDEGIYTIQTLKGSKPRVLVSSAGEISGLNMIRDSVYFVQRPTDTSWRIGSVRITGGEPSYSNERKGRTPAMLTGSDNLYFYSLDTSEIRKTTLDLKSEESVLKDFVCSPVNAVDRIYCGCVEGLFEVSKESRKPRVLVFGRKGSITNIKANSKLVAWTVDTGPNTLAVDMLPARADASSAVPVD